MMAGRWLAASLALAALAGCGSLAPKLQEPRLEVVDITLLKSDLLQQQLKVRLRVINPNDRELPVRGISCQMELAGHPFADGQSEHEFVVPALGSAEFDVGVTANAAGALLKMLGGGHKLDTLPYRLHGKVSLSSGLLRSIPFDKTGDFKLR